MNVWEVYYERLKRDFALGETFLWNFQYLPIHVIDFRKNEIFYAAGQLKAVHNKMSVADAIGLATASCSHGTFVTCDHSELDKYEPLLDIPFFWIRPPQPKRTKTSGRSNRMTIEQTVVIPENRRVYFDVPPRIPPAKPKKQKP
jgi:hypothetical protein